jgi:YVTN family beta-propeller protein
MDPRIGSMVAGYRVESLLGRGGMSVVYLAEDDRLHRKVALKLLSAELSGDAEFRDRFNRESRLAASIDHPNVVPIYEAGDADGLLFIAMRYVGGTDLAELLKREGSLDPARTARIVEQIAEALEAAHERHLVHRDVKPANVLVTEGRGGREHVYLSDFGITRKIEAGTQLTATGQLLGTVDYVAPEQIRGGQVDGRADIYSLGCLLYECLTGEPPFVRDSEVAVIYAHVQEPPPRPSDRRPDLPREIDAVTTKAMAKEPSLRYQQAGELAAAASAALIPAPQAPPDKAGTRTRAWAAGIAAAALVIVAVLSFNALRRDGTGSSPTTAPPRISPSLLTPPEAAVAGVSGIYRIDPAGGLAVGLTPLRAQTPRIATGGGFVWLASLTKLQKIDPGRSAVIATIDVALSATPGVKPQVEVGFGSVWAITVDSLARIVRVDPRTNGIVARIPMVDQAGLPVRFLRMSIGENALWVVGRPEGSGNYLLLRIDPETNNITDIRSVAAGDDVAAGEGAVWILDSGLHPKVLRIDAKSLRQVDRIPLPGADAIAVGLGSVFVSNTSEDKVVLIDPLTDSAFATIGVGDGPLRIAVGEGAVWVLNSIAGTISKVDPRLQQVTLTIDVRGAVSLAAGEGALWVVSCGRPHAGTECT